MQRNHPIGAAAALAAALAACGGRTTEDECGSGRPRWVRISPPEGVDFQFRRAIIDSDSIGYSVSFDGEKLMFWGGYRVVPGSFTPTPAVQGAFYYPLDDRWEPWPDLDDPNAPAVAEHTALQSTSALEMLGGVRPAGASTLPDLVKQSYVGGGEPGFETHVWRAPEPIDPSFREGQPTLATDRLVLGVTDEAPHREFAYGGPSLDPIDPPPTGLSPYRTERGGEDLVFGWNGLSDVPEVTGGIFNGTTWAPLPEPGRPQPRLGHSVAGTIVWGGQEFPSGRLVASGARLNGTDEWRPLTESGAPSPRKNHAAAWTGDGMLVYGGSAGGEQLRDGAIYDWLADKWTAVPEACAPPAMANPIAIWTTAQRAPNSGWMDNAVFIWGNSLEEDGEGVGGIVLVPGRCCESPSGFQVNITAECGSSETEHPIDECAELAEEYRIDHGL